MLLYAPKRATNHMVVEIYTIIIIVSYFFAESESYNIDGAAQLFMHISISCAGEIWRKNEIDGAFRRGRPLFFCFSILIPHKFSKCVEFILSIIFSSTNNLVPVYCMYVVSGKC
jgi:hypothetical protein